MRLTLLLCIFLLPLSGFSQTTEGIEYSPSGIFHWGMFRGKINPKHLAEMGRNTGAVTVSSLSYETIDIDRSMVTLKVTARFHPRESWTRYPHLPHPDEALEHEKRHFDVCEVYARRLRQLISQTQFHPHNFDDVLRAMFKKVVAEYRSTQARYDQETQHSLDARQQALWNARIDRELELLADYADNVITIKLE